MHDWTILSIVLDWTQGKLTIHLKDSMSQPQYILIEGLHLLNVPRNNEWGKSISINKVTGPSSTVYDCAVLEIEIQSGDVIHVEAKSIIMPVLA